MNKKHGFTSNRFYYSVWTGLNQRCKNPKSSNFSYYGGKGIKVEWKSFQEFKDDMYDSYKEHVRLYGQKNTSIDRINFRGNYSKENCRWVTWREQQGEHRVIPRGEKSGKNKLTNEQVLEIRELKNILPISNVELGKMFGVRDTTIMDIVRRLNWKHI